MDVGRMLFIHQCQNQAAHLPQSSVGALWPHAEIIANLADLEANGVDGAFLLLGAQVVSPIQRPSGGHQCSICLGYVVALQGIDRLVEGDGSAQQVSGSS